MTDLFALYRGAEFVVEDGDLRFTIRVDERCAALDDLLARCGGERWAYLTAWNPGTTRRSDVSNRRTQARLLEAVRRANLQVFRGVGRAPDGSHEEESVLVVGMSEEDACDLGARFGQWAIVVGSRGHAAQLIDLRPRLGALGALGGEHE